MFVLKSYIRWVALIFLIIHTGCDQTQPSQTNAMIKRCHYPSSARSVGFAPRAVQGRSGVIVRAQPGNVNPPQLNMADFPALWDWTGGAHWDINDDLYRGVHGHWLSQQVQMMEIEALKIPRYSDVVYSGKPNKFFKEYEAGHVIAFDGYLSTSKDPAVASHFGLLEEKSALLVIESVSGVEIETISKFPLEKEVLFMRHDLFLVTEVVKVKNIEDIDAFKQRIPTAYVDALSSDKVKRFIFMTQLHKPRSIAPLP
ncbi:MAG: hypothetical protein CMP10_01435 [Zetaproteobacteria bacterium]|nr:hypothetical protein [Pseudobdellovibrionaceae bacterium]